MFSREAKIIVIFPQCNLCGQALFISPNEVLGDIMVLAPCPPVDPDDVNTITQSIQRISFKFYTRVDTPLRYFAIEIWYPPMTVVWLRTQLFYVLVSPKSSKCNISITNGPIAFKFYTEVKYLRLHIKNYQGLDYHRNCIRWRHL